MRTVDRTVPIFRLHFEADFIERYQRGCADIFASDALTNGEYVRRFEALFCDFQGASHAIAVGSGTDALETAFRAIGVSGKQVIIPTNTFIATAIAAERAGGEMVLADIEDETFSLSPADLERKVCDKTAAVVLVHIGGIISRFTSEIQRICRRAGVPLVEDAAQAHGASRDGMRAGSIGEIGCFSFFPTKVMTTGEGGMITTANQRLYERMLSIRNFGRDPENELICINDGSNFKMTEFQALLGVLEIERVAERVRARHKVALEYQRLFADSTWFHPVHGPAASSSWYKQIVRTNLPQCELHRLCKERGVALTGEVYRYPVHMQPLCRHRFSLSDYPIANAFSESHICPPVYPELDLHEAQVVVDVLNEAGSILTGR